MTELAQREVVEPLVASTVLPRTHARPDTAEVRRFTSGVRIGDLLALLGAAAAALALTTLISSQIAPMRGVLAFVVVAYALFLVVYAVLVSLDETGPVVRDRVIAVLVQSGAFLLVGTLASVLVYTVGRGFRSMLHLNMFTQDMTLAGPLDPLTRGGVMHAIVGTLIQISIALAITIPLGVTTALFLSEVPGRFARFVRTIVEAMTALPSIVAGLFILATFVLMLGFDKSGLAAGLAITVMMLPIMIRAADVVFRLVPHTLKEASLGLGAGQLRTVLHVVLPTSRSGLTTAIILATARGIGETSPVLLTAGFTASLNANPLSGPMVSLPLLTFQFVKSPQQTMVDRGFGAAVVLMGLVLVLFVLARVLGSQDVAKRAARRQRRRARAVRRQALTRRAAALVRRSAPADPDHSGSSHRSTSA
ncbi:phosphate ABC transporter permease PstA [Nocardioides panacihumi]|uniref:Phosphate transport system permease protein PstA n=1 Tax=Nocardioides panacihumi TaxID=400774 RepID=A0ABN2RI83_9ACTN